MARPGLAAVVATTLALAAPAQSLSLQQFRNLNHTFHVDLPATWRQVAPNEARRIGENPQAPADLGYVEPRQFYAVGPVDEWLAGTFTGAWLYVVEQQNEWMVEDDFAERLAEMWQKKGAATGIRHELASVQRAVVGTQQHGVLTAVRTSTPATGRATASLDVYAPAGGRQVSLSFACWADEFPRWEPEFRRWLATLTFARPSRGEQKLSDRLWTPLITGAVVGVVLLLLYKHTHRRR